MKRKVTRAIFEIILLIFVLFFFSLASCAAGSPTIPTATQRQRKTAIAERLTKMFPGYADHIVSDPRFDFEPRTVERLTRRPEPQNKHRPTSPRHNFDYVVSDWARKAGLEFMASNEPVLVGAGSQFPAIPKEIPVGILDAETQYGVYLAKADYPILQTLLTIASFRPNFQKEGWAEEQLISFLRICERNGWDPFKKLGSRTGAMGKPQFEPSSYENLAMHWNGSACEFWKTSAVPADLDRDDDTICSTFNYLHANGFQGSERRWRRALYLYNKDWYYCDAILDIADFFGGRPDHHHYQRIAERRPKQRPKTPQPSFRAAAK